MEFIDLAKQQLLIREKLEMRIKKVLDSGKYIMGFEIVELEEKLADYTGVKHCITCSSGTDALLMPLMAQEIGTGDAIITTPFTFIATAEVIRLVGATPVFVDINPDTYNINSELIPDAIQYAKEHGLNTKAIIPVDLFGLPAAYEQIQKIAEENNLFVLEDAAHAVETVSNTGKVGSTNHAAAFSFYANKNITTGGEGGALSTNDPIMADRVRKLSLHGMSKDSWKRFKLGADWAYDVSELGYKYNMTDIAASFGLEQLTHVDVWHTRRLEIVKYYNDNLSSIEGLILPRHTCGKVHAWHLYVIKIIPDMWKINRNQLIDKINEKGIGTSVHYIPVHMHSYYTKKYGFKHGDFPVAKEFSERVITLPLYPNMTDNQTQYIIQIMNDLWNKYKT